MTLWRDLLCSARAPCRHSPVTVWSRTFLKPLRRALRRCVGIRRDCDGWGVFEYDDRIRGCISLAANLDSMVTDKRQVSSLFVRIHRRLTSLEDTIDLLVGWSRDFFDSRTVQRDLAESVLFI
jgi:hypothetical protein